MQTHLPDPWPVGVRVAIVSQNLLVGDEIVRWHEGWFEAGHVTPGRGGIAEKSVVEKLHVCLVEDAPLPWQPARQVRIIYTIRGLQNMDVIDEAAVAAKYGIPGRAYADFAALRGDPSDGLPGIPGIGEKTAAALIQAFGSVDGIRHALDMGHGGFPKGARDKLAKARDYLDVSMSVVRVADNVPLPPVTGTLPVVAPSDVLLDELGERWGLGSSLSRFRSAVS